MSLRLPTAKAVITVITLTCVSWLPFSASADTASDILKRSESCMTLTGAAKVQACYTSLSEALSEIQKGTAYGNDKLKLLQTQSTVWSQMTSYFSGFRDYQNACRAAAANMAVNRLQAAQLQTMTGADLQAVREKHQISFNSLVALQKACEGEVGVVPAMTPEELRGFLN